MENNTNTPIPEGMEKQKFVKIFHPIPADRILIRINEIIFDNRKCWDENQNKSERQIKSTKFIEKSEMIEYFETYGYPNCYRQNSK